MSNIFYFIRNTLWCMWAWYMCECAYVMCVWYCLWCVWQWSRGSYMGVWWCPRSRR